MDSAPYILKKYVYRTLGFSLAILLVIGLVSYYIDPYNFFGVNKLGVYISCEREYKAQQIYKYSHNALLIGNSRSAMINVSQLKQHRFFNAACGGEKHSEIYHFLKKHLSNENVVIIGISIGEMDPQNPSKDFFNEKKWKQISLYLFNIKNIEFCVKTLAKYLKKAPRSVAIDGSGNQVGWMQHFDTENVTIFNEKVNQIATEWSHYKFHENSLNYLKKIKNLLESRHIKLITYIEPVCEPIMAIVKKSDGYQEWQKWKVAVKQIFPDIVDLSESAYGKREYFFRIDPCHFRSETGIAFLNNEVIR
ncbi:MAG: hypothetical protein A2007_02795 [Verrucomicrobia bacterium GWC2_42_7]|nr:MAG: hypothetical protein A2007_02795 [Verrucomicrobia bacterium GWC2_42_7]